MWYRLIDWFNDLQERRSTVTSFNKSARNAFISNHAPTLLEARTTIGSSEFRHEFSKFMGGGFRIKALSGKPLQKSELIEIGKVVIDNVELVRKLVALGWDTLEVHDDTGFQGCKWELKKFAQIGGYLK